MSETVRVVLYLHSSKETAYDAAKEAGLAGEALSNARYLGYEHKMEYDVDSETGDGVLVTVDGRQLLSSRR